MTEPDPLTTKDYSRIEQRLSTFHRPCSVVSLGWIVFFAALLVIIILVIETLAPASSLQPANQIPGDSNTLNFAIISTNTPTLQATATAMPAVLPTRIVQRTLASGLRIEEYPLVGAPSLEPLTFTTVQGTQPDIFFLPSTPLDTHANQSFDASGHLTSSVVVGNDKFSVTEITGDSTASGNGGVFQVVAIQVARNDQIIDTIQAGDASPIGTLRGLWVFGDNHWVLEIAHVTSMPGPDNSVSFDAVGQIFLDDVLLNERNNYQAAFGFQTMNGRPFYFFKRDGRINIVYDGQEMLLGYTEIPHYGCCSAAELNPKSYVDGVTFLAQRDGRWYYVGIGITAAAQSEPKPAETAAPGVVKPEVLAAIRKFSGQDPANVVYRGKTPVDPSMPGMERDMYSTDGAEYGLDPKTNQVLWFNAVPDQTAGNQTYTVDELQQMALQFVTAHTPGVSIQSLSFERGNKLENYFFRWSTASTGPGYLAYVQVGYRLDGVLFQYINTLPAGKP
jgi:hypothetical protein